MLLRSATYHNIGPFKDWRLDVEDKRGLVALVAPNGVGKTSAVEIGILGGCYRMTKTQGTLKERATARDAWVETAITYGKPYTIRQLVDPQLKTAGESLVLDASGADQLGGDTKVSTYDAWSARYLPDDDVFLAGPFCAQGDDGFVSMGSAERIAVILRVRGVAKLEKMAKVFAKRAAKASDAFQTLVSRIADARAGVLPEADAVVVLEAAERTASEADEAVLLAKSELAACQQRAADHAINKASREAAQKHLATLTEQRDAALARVRQAESALAADRAVRSDAAAIRAAVAQLPSEEAALAELRAAYAAADAGVRAELDPWRDGAQRRAAAEQRRTAALGRLADERAILAAVASKGALKEAAEAERGAVAGAEAAVEALGAKHVADLGERVTALRAGHEEVIDTAFDPKATSARVLAADDAAVAAATEVPKRQAAAKELLRTARERQAAADRKLAEAERLAARAADLPAARADLAAAEAELAELLSGHAVAVVAALARSLSRLEVAVAGKARNAEIEPLRRQAARLAALESAEGRSAELEKQAFTDQTQAERLRVEIAEIEAVEVVDLGEAPDVAGAERAVSTAEAAAKEAAGHVARAEQNVARGREVDARVSKLETERDAAAAELADWTRLEHDFGRKGIQSAEVDSSGPELTELCNDLLHRCHGPQFTVEVKTQRLDGDGKKMIEECNVTVFDSVKGTKKELRQHSGGEKVLLGIAMRLALSMMACRKAGFTDFTFVCDEGGAALDPANNRAFVAMLRHALAITGARHVLLVSHSEEVQKMCDHVIEIPEAA